jgi:photosystem II stability/assembly factor-like uncharacterized protein
MIRHRAEGRNMKEPAAGKRKWTITGPGGGAIFLPTINPHDNSNVITVCDMTGGYISDDAGESWREFNLKTRICAAAFDPAAENTVYAGSSGLFRSEDKGWTWKLVFPDPDSVTDEKRFGDEAEHLYLSSDNWPGGKIHGIAIDPVRTDNIHLCIDTRYEAGELVVFSSHDRGRTWSRVAGIAGKRLRKLYLDPSSPLENRRLFAFTDAAIHQMETTSFRTTVVSLPQGVTDIVNAGCGTDPSADKPVFFILSPTSWKGKKFQSGMYRSKDLGRTWREMDGGLDDDLHGPDNGQSRKFKNLGVTDKDCRTVWVDVWREPGEFFANPQPEMNYLGIMKSSDMGETWHWSMKAGAEFPDNLAGGWKEREYGTDWYEGPLGMSASPANPDICWFTGYMGIYRTLDGGRTWGQYYSIGHPDLSSTSRGINVTTCFGVHFDPFESRHMAITYADNGLQHSRNGGESWKHAITGVPGPWTNTCYWLAFDPSVKDRVWSVWAHAHDLPRFKMFGDCHFETSPGGVCRSDDGMETWAKSNSGMPENGSPVHIVLDPRSPIGKRTLYVACMGAGVYKSSDDGRTWLPVNSGFGGNLNAWRLAILPDGILHVILFSGFKQGRVVAGQIFRSADGARSWQEIAMPEDANAPSDLQYDPDNPSRMYLSCWPQSDFDMEPKGGLFRTEDGGASWKRIYGKEAYAYALEVDPNRPSTLFFTSFDGSVRRSDDRGESWRRLRGYNFKWPHRPIVDPHDKDMIYVTTFGSSVWHGPADGDDEALEDIVT